MKGSLPPCMSNMSSLTTLTISNTPLTGVMPSDLSLGSLWSVYDILMILCFSRFLEMELSILGPSKTRILVAPFRASTLMPLISGPSHLKVVPRGPLRSRRLGPSPPSAICTSFFPLSRSSLLTFSHDRKLTGSNLIGVPLTFAANTALPVFSSLCVSIHLECMGQILRR